jgi:hypothetical protein
VLEPTGFHVFGQRRGGGWSTARIGRFYNGRHHTTVLHAIEKIKRLRQEDGFLDALLEVITLELSLGTESCFTGRSQLRWTTDLIEAVADRVLREISRLTAEGKSEGHLPSAQSDGVVCKDSINVDKQDYS